MANQILDNIIKTDPGQAPGVSDWDTAVGKITTDVYGKDMRLHLYYAIKVLGDGIEALRTSMEKNGVSVTKQGNTLIMKEVTNA